MGLSSFALNLVSRSIVKGLKSASQKAEQLDAPGVSSALKKLAKAVDGFFDTIGVQSNSIESANDLDNLNGFDAADGAIRFALSSLAGAAAGAAVLAVGSFAILPTAGVIAVGLVVASVADTVVSDIVERFQEDYNLLTFSSLMTSGARFQATGLSDGFLGGRRAETVSGGDSDDKLFGMGGADILKGNGGNDTLKGGKGADTLEGGRGDDVISGGNGKDTISGGPDQDTIYGGNSDDVIDGGDGADTISGGDENDDISGGAGNDVLRGDDGKDFIQGGRNVDTIFGGRGNDRLFGDSGADTLRGGRGNDVLKGGDQADFLYGDQGRDEVDGGAGDDFIFVHYRAKDTVSGGKNDDTIVITSGFKHVVDGGPGHDVLDLRGINANKFNYANVTNIEEIWVDEVILKDKSLSEGKFVFHGNKKQTFNVPPSQDVEFKVFGENPFSVARGSSFKISVTWSDSLDLTGLYDNPVVGQPVGNGMEVVFNVGSLKDDGYVDYSSYGRSFVNGGQQDRQDHVTFAFAPDAADGQEIRMQLFERIRILNTTETSDHPFIDQPVPPGFSGTWDEQEYRVTFLKHEDVQVQSTTSDLLDFTMEFM